MLFTKTLASPNAKNCDHSSLNLTDSLFLFVIFKKVIQVLNNKRSEVKMSENACRERK